MTKLKNFFNNLTSRWDFLYVSIYGVIAFVLGIMTIFVSKISLPSKDLELLFILSSIPIFCNSLVSVFTAITISILLTPIKKLFQKSLYLILLFCIFLVALYLDKLNSAGIGMTIMIFLFKGIPITIGLLLIPYLILPILESKNKIKLLNLSSKQKGISFIFYAFGILNLFCIFLLCLFWLLL